MRHILFIFFLITPRLFSQELPPIQNFFPKEYDGENQNWDISQSEDKIIYVANSKGLLAFNGASWELYPSTNETIMRSVRVVEDRIYTGCYMEFGYWQKNNLGMLEYTSLSSQMSVDLLEDEEFWTIISIDDWIVFQSLKRIYIYDTKTGNVEIIDSDSTIIKMFEVDQKIYFQRIGKGIYKIDRGKEILVFEDDIVKNDEVINMFGSERDPLFLTQDNGFFVSENNSLVPSNTFPNELLSKLSLYEGIQLKNGGFVLGTIADGLICLSVKGELRFQIDQINGLSNNTVLAAFEDKDENIWLGLDYGMSYVDTNSPYEVFNDKKGVLGSIYAAAVYGGNLYLGTNQGLFYKDFNSKGDFNFIQGTQGQVWSLREIYGTLFCGHHSGTFIIKNDLAKRIADIQGTWGITSLDDNPGLLLQGNYDGLYVLEKSNDSWKLRNRIKGFNNSSRYFEPLGDKIFVNHEYNGVFEIDVDSAFFEAMKVSIDTVLRGSNSGIIKHNGNLLYSYRKGIYRYDMDSQGFVKDSLLSMVYSEDEYESGKLIVDEQKNILWVFTKSNISLISPSGLSNTLRIRNIPLTKEVRNGILGYENITRLNDEGHYLIGTTSGYITVNLEELGIEDFQVFIEKALNGGNKIKDRRLLDKKVQGDFRSDENHLEFSFYAPEFNKYLSTLYQYQLEGIYDDWSDWSESSHAIFENLPYGEYTFNVRAKIGNTISTNTASYSFSIRKPWYISNLMITLYVLGLLLFLFSMHNLYKRYYSKKQQKLIESSKRELQLAQVQNEKEIIKLKNKQLERQFKDKSNELAASTMSIIKKNELLTSIKNELKTLEDAKSLRPVIKIIDKSLNQNNDWELFKEAFNNADSDFFKEIKKLHPSLSPNDLKLCAYLRLNLSSKEIAKLLNMSPRSVEIKRYRLRKKLGLKHEENLVNYILKL